MARDGSGRMLLPFPHFVAGTTIVSAEVDANFADIVDEITNTLAADGRTTVAADISMNLKRFTELAAGSAAADSATLSQIQSQAYLWCGTAGGVANALTLSPGPAPTAYAAGQAFRFIAAADNTGPATVDISGLGPKDIRNNGAALADGDIKSGRVYEIVYDGAQFRLSWWAMPSEFIKTLMNDADAAAARSTLGLGIGTDVQAYDTDLAAIAGLTSSADTLAYYTGAAAAALTGFTSQARQLLGETSFSAMRATLGLAIGTDVNEYLNTMSQAEAEAGTATTRRIVTAQRMAQAIGALSGTGNAKLTSFTSSGTFTPDPAAVLTHVYLWGGGGGGARDSGGFDAGGGGGGGFAAATYAADRIGSGNVSVGVGSGAIQRTSDGNGAGGTASQFGSFVSAGGGSGGLSSSGGAGGGATISVAALASQTESGANGGAPGNTGGNPADGYAGAGGAGSGGSGGGASAMGGDGGDPNNPGSSPGGGGGGGNATGGAGGNGRAVVVEILV